MNSLNPKLSIVVPIYNEEQNILALNERLLKAVHEITPDFEIIYIDDGSTDGSYKLLQSIDDARSHYIKLSRNFGHQIAVSAGLEHTRGNAVVIIDGDMQDPPEVIPLLYAKYCEGFHVVYAKRRKRDGESTFKLMTARFFYRFLNKITSIDIPLDTGDFRLIDKSVVSLLKQMPEKNKFLRGQIAWLGLKQTEILYDRDARLHGSTGYTFRKMLNLAITGITGFSDKPLRLVSRLGFYISGLSFLLIIYALHSHFILEKTITGWTSMILAISFFGGIQLLTLGIIGEYLSRMHHNLQDRPLYIIEDSNCIISEEKL